MKIGSVYHLVFWDHVAGGDSLMKCEVFGRLVKADGDSVTIASWLNSEDSSDEDNREVFCIAKQLILKKKLLK